MRHLLLAAVLISAAPLHANAALSIYKRVAAYLNGPAVKKAPRHAAVAAVRGGIPTDQGEDLDLRLLDRARALREALKRPDPSVRDAALLRLVYQSLAASQYVQALAIVGAPEARGEASAALEAWAKDPTRAGVPAPVLSLFTGPAARIDDRALVAAGWGPYTRRLAPQGAATASAAAGWTSGEEASRLDETLKGLSDSWLQRKLEPSAEAKAHLLAGQVYEAMAAADLTGRAPARGTAAAAASPALDDGPAPVEASVAFEPKAVYQKAAKAVVLILCASAEGTGELGTGTVVDAARRRILTNSHVVIQDSTRKPWSRVRVYFKPAKMTGDPKRDLVEPVEGKVIAWDPALDLALVEVDRLPGGTPSVALGHPDAVSVGDRVAAIGHPEQGGLWTLTTGVISTVLADLGGVKGKDAFQTDTSINRGNSGGPLLDASGRLVGVNTSMSRKAADGLAITSINFAVRSDVARRWMAGQGQTLAYGGASVSQAEPAALAKIPDPVPAPPPVAVAVADPAVAAPAVAAAAPRARGRSTARAPKENVMVTESKPFSVDGVIEAEISKMDELGNEMADEIKRRRNKKR